MQQLIKTINSYQNQQPKKVEDGANSKSSIHNLLAHNQSSKNQVVML